jgi:hypothetical protein
MKSNLNRRQMLRGTMFGGALTIGLPFFDCFLDGNGTALASGAPMPARFGTWFWGLGWQREASIPTRVGAGFDLRGQFTPLAPYARKLNLFSNYATLTDGRPNFVHHTGAVLLRSGQAPVDKQQIVSETIDVTIADAIGGASRFASLDVSATNNRLHSYSARGPNAVNAMEISPVDLFMRVYGPEFQNPNASTFTPNPEVVLRRSVLSGVMEDSARLRQSLGAADRARFEEYQTSLRSMEQRMALQLERPPRAPQCTVPSQPAAIHAGMDWELVGRRHNALADVLVSALACNQTRVFNVIYSWAAAETIKQGLATTHHITTHEESRDDHGIQVQHEWFLLRAMESFAYFLGRMNSVREGDRTLLDNTLIYAHSEHSEAQMHAIDGIPVMTAGSAGGRIRTGIHFDGNGESASKIGLTAMRAMGLSANEWGANSMRTSEFVGGLLA